MGRRRKRTQNDDNDDTLERKYFQRKSKITNDDSVAEAPNSKMPSTTGEGKDGNTIANKNNDGDDIERKREKKRLKKQRQREKKEAAQRQEETNLSWNEKIQKARLQEKTKNEERKNLEKKAPSINEFQSTFHDGVKYCEILVGKGPFIQHRKRVVCNYVLRAKHKKGKIIDSGSNFSFRMGKGEVIKGWEIGLLKMRQGGIRHILVDPSAGYGNQDIGGGKGADLYFEVTLIRC